MRIRSKLRLSAAGAALAIAASQPALAACETDGSAVTCSGTTTVTQAEAAAAAAAAGATSVSFSVLSGANVVQPDSELFVLTAADLAFSNAGTIGTEAAPVSVRLASDGSDVYDLAFVNSGEISGNFVAHGWQGAVTVENSGTVAGINVSAAGPVTITATGDVGAPGAGGINATSSEFAFDNESTTETVDGVTTTNYAESAGNVSTGEVSVAVGPDATVGRVFAAAPAGVSVDVDGTVGSADQSGTVLGRAVGSFYDYTQGSVSDPANGLNSAGWTFDNASNGGSVSIAIGAEGSVYGAVSANANTDATIDNAGTIAGFVNATAQGFETTDAQHFESFVDPDGTAERYSDTRTTTNLQTGGIASVSNAAGELIGLDQTSRVQINARGIGGAEFTNQGRVNGDVTLVSAGIARSYSDQSVDVYNYDPATGALTDATFTSTTEDTSADIGGVASFTNGANGLMVGSVNAAGIGGVVIVNEGAVTGSTDARSDGWAETDRQERVAAHVFAEDGSRTFTETLTTAFTEETVGGDVSGRYAGSNGAVQFAPGDASDGSIYQLSNGTNSAAITGLVLGNVTLQAYSNSNTTESAYVAQSQFDDAGVLTAFESSQTSAGSSQDGDASATLAVNGGTVEGSVHVSATGAATVALGNGAVITNDLAVETYGDDYENQTVSDVAEAYEGGILVSRVSNYELTETRTSTGGDVSLTMGEATVEGELLLTTEAGAVSATIGADAVIGGDFEIFAGGGIITTSLSDSSTLDADGSTRDFGYQYEATSVGGNVTATVAGTIGDDLNVDGGDVAIVVSGVVGDEIELEASRSATTGGFAQSYVDGMLVSSEGDFSSTAIGGSASLSVLANEAGDPTNHGNVEVYAVADATLEIGEGATVSLDSGYVNVSTETFDYASSYFQTYEDGALVSSTQSQSVTPTGGAATLTNAGVIGNNGGAFHPGANANVFVSSFESALAENTGQIYGNVGVRSLGTGYTQTITEEGLGDVLQTRTTETAYVPVGGTASLVNDGLITGLVSVAAAEGTVDNNAVIRRGIHLGASVDNYSTTRLDTFTQVGEEEVTEEHAPFVQSYTVHQNGLLGGGITVEGAFGLIDDSVMTSAIDATVNLNGGSVTTGTILAEYDDETGERYTDTTVNLVGAGYLGLSDANAEDLSDAFAAADPRIAAFGDLDEYVGGARVLGVETLAKSGQGAFVFHGASFAPQSETNAVADWTVDAGLVSIDGGELQLSTDDGVFGIRGDLVNGSSLVLGERVRMPQPLFGSNLTTGGLELVDGIEISQQGNFTQTTAGALSVGMMPSLVRYVPSAVDPVGYSNELLGVQFIDVRQGLFTTPENALGEHADFGDSFVTLDGNLDLAGTVNLVMPRGGIFADGEKLDLFSVSGTVAQSASVVTQDDMNFVSFGLTTRQEGGRTIVSVGASRIGYDTVATNSNAAAAGAALSASVPNLVAALRADADGEGTFGSVRELALAQDLATVVAGFDSLLTKSQVAVALNELASGEFYGSLTTVETTAPFIDAISNRRTAQGQGGFGLWLAPSGDFAKFDGDEETGASDISVDNYGGSMGFSVSTGAAELGLGGGYGHIEADSEGQPVSATADTWMVGAYGQYASGPVFVGANVVFGWSDWDANRSLPTFGREAEGTFDSKELRADLRGEYRFDLGTAFVAPFAEAEIRRYDFDGFTEEGAGALGLVVEDAEKTVFTPSIGLKFGTAFTTDMAVIRPEASLSYSFRGDNDAFRDVAYAGAPSQSFRLQGVDPDGFVTGKLGLFADIGANSGAFVRGSYSTGGGTDIAGLNAGVSIGF